MGLELATQLAKSFDFCGPSLEAIGRNAIFYEFFSFLGPEVPISYVPANFAGT